MVINVESVCFLFFASDMPTIVRFYRDLLSYEHGFSPTGSDLAMNWDNRVTKR